MAVADAIANATTGLGTSRDKTRGNTYLDIPPLDVYTLESLFANNDLAYTIVAKPVDDALRAWFRVEMDEPDENEAEGARLIQMEMERLCARDTFKAAATWGRLLGGGGVIVVARGAGDPRTPLDDTKVTGIDALIPCDRQDLQITHWYADGKPQSYLYTPPTMGNVAIPPQEIHASRILMFEGARTTRRRRIQNQGWSLSVLQRVYEVLSSFDAMWASVDNMFADASQAVFKMQGLIESLMEDASKEGQDDVRVRLSFMDMVRSSAKAIMLDAGNKTKGDEPESFEVVERKTLGQLDGVIQMYMIRLATAARMPLTVLLGMAPAGMDATGESDLILYFNTIDTYRCDDLEPQLLRFVRMVARYVVPAEVEEPGEAPEPREDDVMRWRVVWPELARPKPVDVSTTEKMHVDGVVALVSSQVILPEEAALNLQRYAPGLQMRLDLKARRDALKEGLAEVSAREVGLSKLEAEEAVSAANQPKDFTQQPASSGRKTPAASAGNQT